MEVRWLDSALSQLEAIQDYIAADNSEDVAADIADRIWRIVEVVLPENPQAGRRSRRVDGVFELVMPDLPYIIFYRISSGQIQILHVRDGRRRAAVKRDILGR